MQVMVGCPQCGGTMPRGTMAHDCGWKQDKVSASARSARVVPFPPRRIFSTFCSQCLAKTAPGDKFCPQCGAAWAEPSNGSSVQAPNGRGFHRTSAAASPAGIKDHSHVIGALQAYVGQNWDSHYRATFDRLLHSRGTGVSTGWTWNWSAALVPVWYLYRRLYLPFFGFCFLYTFISAIDQAAAGSAAGGSPLAVLFIVQMLAMGLAGDRLLFRKAYAKVTSERAPRDPAALAALGRPLKWVIWSPLVILTVGLLAAYWLR
jgi:hypothetical protein